jgi:chromosome segregation ATPase
VQARPDADALRHHARDLNRALTALTADGADLAAVIRSLSLHAGLVERLGRAVDEQWARIASLEALLFAEHQSLRAVVAGESHRIRSTATAESEAARSELNENARLVHEEVDKLAQLLTGQADAIRSLQNELAGVRRGLVLPTLRRWLGRADG